MTLEGFDFDEFARSHEMCRAITRASIDFLEHVCGGDLFAPKLPFAELEVLRSAVQAAYQQYVAPPKRKGLRLKVVATR